MSRVRCPGQDPMFLKAQDIAEAECPQCGQKVEFWPDELIRACRGCGHRVRNPQNAMKCLEWCRYAARCLAALRSGDESWVGPLREEFIERMRKAFGSDEQRIGHALAVLRAAEEIGREAGADPFVLVPAAIFHDVGRSLPHCGDAEHGPEGRRLTAELLADLHIPGAVQDEILSLIEHHHERDRMAAPTMAAPTVAGATVAAPNGAVLFDADLIVNLEESRRADAPSVLEREALTEASKRVGRSWLRAGH